MRRCSSTSVFPDHQSRQYRGQQHQTHERPQPVVVWLHGFASLASRPYHPARLVRLHAGDTCAHAGSACHEFEKTTTCVNEIEYFHVSSTSIATFFSRRQ